MTTAAQTKEVATKRKTLPELLNDAETQKRFTEMLGKDARSFQQNILTVYNGSKSIQECDPESIIAGCAISASINLSILPSLGQSCIVPYKDGDRLVAQWQIMTRGVVALALRSEQYKKINLARVYDGQLVEYDEFKGTVKLNAGGRKSDRVQGYFFYFELLNGYTREAYWSAKKCVEHGLRFSKSFQKGGGKWAEDVEFVTAKTVKAWLAGKEHFLTEGSGADAMSAKTAVKNELTKWGPLETRIKEIINLDQAVINKDGTPRYVDTTAVTDAEPKAALPPPTTKKGGQPTAFDKLAWLRAAAEQRGVPIAAFDAWLAKQGNGEESQAIAAEAAWQRVVKKEVTAAQAFGIEAAPAGEEASLQVSGVGQTDFNGEPAFVVRDSSEPVVKYYTESEAVFNAAKAAREAEAQFKVRWVERKAGKHSVRWIVSLA